MVLQLILGPIWFFLWSCKQPVVARSSTDAEYRTLAHVSAELLWVHTMLTKPSVPFTSSFLLLWQPICCSLTHNPIFHGRTVHMEIDVFFVQEKVLEKHLTVQHILVDDQWAGILTKPVSNSKFLLLRPKLNVTAPTLSSQQPWSWGV